MRSSSLAAVFFGVLLPTLASAQIAVESGLDRPNFVAGKLIELNDNGAWSWFMDERAIVHDGKLIVGSVRAVGNYRSGRGDENWGNVELAVHDIDAGTTERVGLHPRFEQDDHDGPGLLALPDGRILAVYTRHGVERTVFWRISEPNEPTTWGPVREFNTPGRESRNFSGDNVTYSNLFQLSSGRILNIHRGYAYDPNWMYSDDEGQSWHYGGRLMRGRDGYGPYFKYAFDGKDTIHIVATEDHPRNFDNSLYHGFWRDRQLFHSDGRPIGSVSTTTDATIRSWDLTRVFQGDPDNVAWMADVELDASGRPYVVFSVQKDGRGLRRGQGGQDHRFHFGRWDGAQWRTHEMAYAGTRLYAGEDDYTGLAALDPQNANVVYISTDADPTTGEPLVSSADGRRHRELYRGRTADSGATWNWEPITANSAADNLRPIIPRWDDPRTALIWMRGEYRNNRGEWRTKVVALLLPSNSNSD
jgi:hypothetical protein